ncbi:MAG: FHA domain-containing protein [Lachnospiraceae bacterium]|jgi:hypothetical protein|nr:FHA domain-containing protein [Lachnospiraceae bacterium]
MGKAMAKCPNGHFYESDKFAACPFCESVVGGGNGQKVTMPIGENPGMNKTIPTDEVKEMQKTEPIKSADDNKDKPNGNLTDKFDKDIKKQGDMQKTVSFFSENGSNQVPAVGLLLCVEGDNFGETYLLKAGKNFIGRSNTMDVVISEDNSVSREKHAIILYEPRKRMFLAQPGESSELYYVNGEVVLNVLELHEYDEISLGKTKLLFVPICGPQFSWEDYTK